MEPVTQASTRTASPVKQTKADSLWAQASVVRHRARGILNGRSGRDSHRLTLVLSLVIILTVAVALYAAMAGLALAGSLIFPDALWVDVAVTVLTVALCLALVLPLLASTWRLACLMAAPDGEVVDGMAVSVPAATLSELFYPFTSFRAYGRTMAVAMEGLGFTLLSVGGPILCFRLALLSLSALAETAPFLYALVAVAAFLICLALGLLFFLLSGKRAGFGYFVFMHSEMSLGDVHRYYRGFRRPLLPVFCLRVSLAGWYALSVAGILVPFLLHTAPYGFCCAAMYSRMLNRR